MANFFNKNTPSRIEKNAKSEILLCKECNSAYWYKTWHHSLDDHPNLKEDRSIRMVVCPACRIQEEGKYQGELILENIPTQKNQEIKNLVINFSDISFKNDPMSRLINIDEIARGMIRAIFTESQIVGQLSKKIKKIYKGKINFIHSKKDAIIRIRIVFP